MSDYSIKEAVRQLAGSHLKDEVFIVPAEVDSVNIAERSCSCTALNGQNIDELPIVQLMAEVEDGVLYVPAVGSTVMVVYSKRNVPFVALYSELSAIYYVVGDTTIDVTNGLIKLNDGSYHGLVRVEELTAKLNALESKVNDLLNAYNTHVHTGVSSGFGSSAVTTAPVIGTLTPTQQSEIENNKITHGI